MKRNDEIKLQLHIESTETTKNVVTGAIEVRRRSIAKSLDVLYVNLTSVAYTDQLGKITLAIKYVNEEEREYVELNYIDINIINDVYEALRKVLFLEDNHTVGLIRDVFIQDDHDNVLIRYKDVNSEVVELTFDKMNTSDLVRAAVRN